MPSAALPVRVNGHAGMLASTPDAWAFSLVSAEDTEDWPCWPLACLSDPLPQPKTYPRSEVIGATRQGELGVCLWHCQAKHQGSGPSARLLRKLHHSHTFECSSPTEADQLVVSVQQASSWRGRSHPPRVVAIVNPVSGQGRGQGVFTGTVLPMLRDAAGMSMEVHTTQGKQHAVQIIKGLDLSQVDLILYVGGDGTVFEGMQGLFARPDWPTAVRIPFGTIPTGSGNGMSGSVGRWDAETAAYSVCQGVTHALDIASVLQPPHSRYYVFLSVAYGLMANLDIGTENLRWLGEARFTAGGLKEIVGARFYPLRAAYFPATSKATHPHLEQHKVDSNGGLHEPDMALLRGMSHSCSGTAEAPDSQTPSPQRMSQQQPHSSPGKACGTHEADTPLLDGSSLSQGQARVSVSGLQMALDSSAPPTPLLSQLGSNLQACLPLGQRPLPPGWVTVPDQLGSSEQYFMLHNSTHLALHANMNPKGCLSDGVWELVQVSGMTGLHGRLQGAQMLLQTDTGAHMELPFVRVDRVQALILEPLAGDSTWLVLDGEAVHRQPIFLEVHPRLCTVLVAPEWRDGPSAAA